MNVSERIQWLKQIDLFRCFSEEDLVAFAENVHELELGKEEILFEEGEPGNDCFILLQGELAVFKQGRAVTTIRPVDYVGEMSIIETKPRSATVQSLGASSLFKITSPQFQRYFAGQPQALVAMMKTLSQRIRHDTEVLAREFEKTNILIHDMKNMLSAFLFLDRFKKENLEGSQGRSIQFMENARRHLADMMEEALANAKRLRRPYTMEKGKLVPLVEDLLESEFKVHPDLQDKSIILETDREIPVFPFSCRDIRRVLTNLVINSAQASQPGDTITIRISHRHDRVEIQIIDRGSGIPAHLRDRVFDAHFTTKEKGSGLGLASCRQIVVERHGGSVSFNSEPGKGTVFVFTLPYDLPS